MYTVLSRTQQHEQTQELRLSDGMPDIGSVLGAWGQVILRGKEWEGDSISVSGGTMVSALYRPEEGGAPKSVESWIPFQVRWPLPDTDRDGVIRVCCSLKSADARTVSARKLILRTNLCIQVLGCERRELELYTPTEVPEDVQLNIGSYPVLLPSEMGEKAFALEEQFPLPAGKPKPEKVISQMLLPQITEHRIMGDKIVFRGSGLVDILYADREGNLHSVNFDLPFSQYGELEDSYAEDATAQLFPTVTALETDFDDEGFRIKTGIVCQYTVRHRPVIQVVEDAYSPKRTVHPQQMPLKLPGILESKQQTVSIRCAGTADGIGMIQTTAMNQSAAVTWQDGNAVLQLPVCFQTLFSDMDGQLQMQLEKCEETLKIPMDPACRMEVVTVPAGRAQSSMLSGNLQLQVPMQLWTDTVMDTEIPMITQLELGEEQEPDPARPSLILCRAGQQSLWELAKAAGSTVEAIRSTNDLRTDPEPGQMLLIPVL